MRHTITYSVLIIAIFTFVLTAHAATPTPRANPTETASKTKQIEDLKERLATKVAELRQTQRRAIAGVIKTVSVSTITVETKTKDVKIELSDNIKVFQILKGVRTKLSFESLEKNDPVVVFGQFDSTLDLLKANVIFIQATPLTRVTGIVKEIDKSEFTVTIATSEGISNIIDIETFTKIFQWTKEQGIAKSGFSKLAVGDTLHVLGTPFPKKENRLSATRILDPGALLSNTTPTNTPAAQATTPTVTTKPLQKLETTP